MSYQAGQKAVVQEANMVLVNIRTAEVQYFSTFFANFGMQSAIVAGAIVGAVSQTPGLDYECSYVFIFMYFTCSSAALVVSCQVLVTTLVASAFGEGLALRGPLGSMVQTIDGMIAEQHHIVFAFVTAIIFFVLQTAAMCMIVMTEYLGYICFAINIIGGFVTYSYALRIYNRFHFHADRVTWEDEHQGSENPVKALDDIISKDPSIDNMEKNIKIAPHNMNPRNHLKEGLYGDIRNRKTNKKGILSKLLPSRNKDKESMKHENYNEFGNEGDSTPYFQMHDLPDNSHKADTDSVFSTLHSNKTTAASHNANKNTNSTSNTHAISEGYMAVRSNKLVTLDPWERRYFVLQNTCIFYFRDKRSYQLTPTEPINSRPIDLEGYTLIAGSSEPPYLITLVPLDPEDGRKNWKFRCDTITEFNTWIEKFRKALASSKANADFMRDLVVMSSSGKTEYNG